MKNIFLFLIMFVCAISAYGQQKLNLGFENKTKDWIIQDSKNNYIWSNDSVYKSEGNYSLHIAPKSKGSLIVGRFINLYGLKGNLEISYTIKSVDVSPQIFIQFLSPDIIRKPMTKKLLDNGWQENSVSHEIWTAASSFAIGIEYYDDEEIWVDDFKITIDGKNIEEIESPGKNVREDKEFDDNSNVTITNPSEETIDNLYNLCKIWGLLKYYNPQIAAGEKNWDYELFRIMPFVTQNKTDFNRAVTNWLDKVEIKELNNKLTSNDSLYEWIDKKTFGDELYQKLSNVLLSEEIALNYYFKLGGAANPEFEFENSYPTINMSDCGYRLLALFRAWNAIEYLFPYKYLTDKNWDQVLREFLPLFIAAQNHTDYVKLLGRLNFEICDSHGRVVDKSNTLYAALGLNRDNTLPIEVKRVEEKYVVVKVDDSKNCELKIGDVITHVKGESMESLIHKYKPYFSVSNETGDFKIYYSLFGSDTDSLNITYVRDENVKTANLKVYKDYNVDKDSVDCKIINDKIGYINIGKFDGIKLDSIMTEFMKMDGLILDLRIYPKSFMIYSIGKYLMPTKRNFVQFRFTSLKHPGLFNKQNFGQIGVENRDYFKGKIVIIVDEGTMSQGEFTTMGWSVAPNAKVIGSQTAGADGNISILPLPGEFKMVFTGLGIYYPDGGETQRVGVRIDEIVKPTIKGIKEGRDELLERAVEIINSK